jgi:5S rRNA maturation endonuclease (ribonuclease M5)
MMQPGSSTSSTILLRNVARVVIFLRDYDQPGSSTRHTMLRNVSRVVRFLKDHDATWNLNKSHNVEK